MAAKRRLLWALVVAVLLVTTAAVIASTATPEIRWWATGAGGRQVSSGGTTLGGTPGQPLGYRAASGNLELCAGFWCGAESEYVVFLSIVTSGSAGKQSACC